MKKSKITAIKLQFDKTVHIIDETDVGSRHNSFLFKV